MAKTESHAEATLLLGSMAALLHVAYRRQGSILLLQQEKDAALPGSQNLQQSPLLQAQSDTCTQGLKLWCPGGLRAYVIIIGFS